MAQTTYAVMFVRTDLAILKLFLHLFRKKERRKERKKEEEFASTRPVASPQVKSICSFYISLKSLEIGG